MNSETFKIRPAGRHILTIGRDLIQDPYAAVVELVKNAYDADATKVLVSFNRNISKKQIEITVEDDGLGMTRDIVVNHWMVPSTNNKQKNKTSPSGRIVQGRKGVGRYSASILGNELLLETVSKQTKEKTSVYVDWTQFENAEYLSDVDILIETGETTESSGTKISITGNAEYLEEWNDAEFGKLRKELKKIISPLKSNDEINFHIYIKINNFQYKEGEFYEEVVPYPLFDLYDYRICGNIEANGKGVLLYETQKLKNIVSEKIEIDVEGGTGCGPIDLDIRAFDRDKDAIEGLISRGLKDADGNYVGKLEARQLLNENCGIGVYRNGFRIRPLGDASFDWLQLDKQRVQNPSKKLGSDQVIGIVNIASEEISNLIEKSARDGLKENTSYEKLITLTQMVIAQLEEKRFYFRYVNGLGRKKPKIERDLEKLISFDSLRDNVRKTFAREHVSKSASDAVMAAISDAEKEKNTVIQSIKEAVALYQGQATMGKIVEVTLHEGRKPLSFFRNQVPMFEASCKLVKEGLVEALDAIHDRINQSKENAVKLVKLFDKLDPLTSGRRGKKTKLPLIKVIKQDCLIFESEMSDVELNIVSSTGSDVLYECWEQDIYSIFTNLVENSLFWMKLGRNEKKISIYVSTTGNDVEYIDYRDSGPGIPSELIESEIIFEPGFSTKETINNGKRNKGTGLGLCIAGEAALRCGWTLEAKESDDGAYFRLRKA